VKHPSKVVAIGDSVEVVVLDADRANKRISLGMRQAEPNPWNFIEERYPVGTRIDGRVRNLADFLAAAKKIGFWVYGAAAGAEQSYTSQDYRYPTCFVVGSEGEGLGRRVASLCDVMVGLPLMGTVESLNVSVSTGILLYEAVRQRGLPAGEGAVDGGQARGGASAGRGAARGGV